MKHLSGSCLSVALFVALSMGYGMDIPNPFPRHQIVPRGTGPSTSNAAISSPTSTPISSAAASEASSTPPSDSSASLPSSSASPTPITATSDIGSTSVTDPSSDSSSSPPNTVSSGSNAGSQTSATPGSSTNIPVSTDKTAQGSITPTPTPVLSSTQRVVTTVIVVSGSSTHTTVQTTSALQAVSSTSSSPTLDNSNQGSNGSGLEPSQKRIIIGVAVGIGGAILLGGLAVVAWRVFGKRKNSADEDHELMDSHPGSSSHEKRSSVSGNSPFRSTLDQYHNPAGPVNTASNF